MITVLKVYIEGDFKVIEYTKDGVNVSHTVKTPAQSQAIETVEVQTSIEEQILAENQYQTALLEMQMLGGM